MAGPSVPRQRGSSGGLRLAWRALSVPIIAIAAFLGGALVYYQSWASVCDLAGDHFSARQMLLCPAPLGPPNASMLPRKEVYDYRFGQFMQAMADGDDPFMARLEAYDFQIDQADLCRVVEAMLSNKRKHPISPASVRILNASYSAKATCDNTALDERMFMTGIDWTGQATGSSGKESDETIGACEWAASRKNWPETMTVLNTVLEEHGPSQRFRERAPGIEAVLVRIGAISRDEIVNNCIAILAYGGFEDLSVGRFCIAAEQHRGVINDLSEANVRANVIAGVSGSKSLEEVKREMAREVCEKQVPTTDFKVDTEPFAAWLRSRIGITQPRLAPS